MEKILLSQFKFFSDIADDKLSKIAQNCNLLKYKADDTIFRFGEIARHFYGVLEGEVELSIVFKDRVLKTEIEYEEAIRVRFEVLEKPIIVDSVDPGEVFGWSSLVKHGRWTATAKCSKPSRIFSILSVDFKAMFDTDLLLGYLILGRVNDIIAQRLQKRTDKLIEAWGHAFEVGKI